jgi:formate hydrogenlyase subunit 3/multisubunit Na+/H+ antiporter MnhD subunit
MSSWLVAAAPAFPLLLSLLHPLPRLRPWLVVVAPWGALPALVLALHPGMVGAQFEVSGLLMGLTLTVDPTGRAFLFLTALLWLGCGLFAARYHETDERRETFFGFFSLTMAGNLGLVLAGDALSFYFLFALMTFAGYGLVTHRRGVTAERAGRVYIVMAILGELFILTGLFALGWVVGTVPSFGGEIEAGWVALEVRGAAAGVALLLILGFGVKAGLVPVHLWLPLAHPVAPTAASALLSGAMIKAGLLAWIRFLPGEMGLPFLGGALIVAGLVAAFWGVIVGLAQDDPKVVLAYSSISQMGYMAAGLGVFLHGPEWAPVAVVAIIAYALHHGVAKAALFLSVGVGDRNPGGGLGRIQGAWVLVLSGLPALALAGAPLTSGAFAKGGLKGAVEGLGGVWYALLDPILIAGAFGTALLMLRFLFVLERRIAQAEGGELPVSGTMDLRIRGPWLGLIGIGLLGPLWYPTFLPFVAGVPAPSAASGWFSALLPVVLAAAVAWVVLRRPGVLGAIGRLRIPPGDLVVPVERTAAMGTSAATRLGAASATRVRWLVERSRSDRDRAPGGTWSDLVLSEGPVLGLLLVLVGAALAAALLL